MDTTKVIFRKFNTYNDNEVIALFPELAADNDPQWNCLSYMHTGQHGACSVGIVDCTWPAAPDEYKDLKNELESIGYNLQIVTRFSRHDASKRIQSIPA